jgi:hypothetical protein
MVCHSGLQWYLVTYQQFSYVLLKIYIDLKTSLKAIWDLLVNGF